MRLTEREREIIKGAVAEMLGEGSIVRLFGSRLDDSQRGGDIDLLVEPPAPLENRVMAECQLTARLYLKLGGRKVDVLIKDSRTPCQPIHQQAMQYGAIL